METNCDERGAVKHAARCDSKHNMAHNATYKQLATRRLVVLASVAEQAGDDAREFRCGARIAKVSRVPVQVQEVGGTGHTTKRRVAVCTVHREAGAFVWTHTMRSGYTKRLEARSRAVYTARSPGHFLDKQAALN